MSTATTPPSSTHGLERLADRTASTARPAEPRLDNTDSSGSALSSATPTTNSRAHAHNAAVLPPLDTASAASTPVAPPQPSAGLTIRTSCLGQPTPTGPSMRAMDTPTIMYDAEPVLHHNLTSPSSLPTMGSSLRSNVSTTSLASSLSPGSASALPSPYLAAMADLTPLPSPLVGNDQPIQWRTRQASGASRSRQSSLTDSIPGNRSHLPPISPDSPRKKKGYGSLMQEAAVAHATMAVGQEQFRQASHGRNRSISDFKPETLSNTRPRHVTIGQGDVPNIESAEYHMHREAHLAEERGLKANSGASSKQLPTPPPSNASMADSDDVDDEQPHLEDGTVSEYLEIHCGIRNKRRKFRPLRELGKGTFSTVMLATREKIPAHPTPEIEDHLDTTKLVAVKIVEHGPAGGADEERIETSLKREVEMLKSVSHPSLIHLKACEYQPTRALLVLTYCPGGDLFDFASEQRDLLTPRLIQRMFAELVSAVKYLHANWIVHRDIKLENVLVNLREADLRAIQNPLTHPLPLVTLTDLGLSRRLPDPPEPPFLTTRCGSEDYAAPEILLGQPYDGRLTDGWALGVLLYALMEGRLPFDAPPGKPERSRNTHRIARCDWIWCRFGDEDGDWDATRGKDFEGANLCVEALLKKVRMGRKSLEEVEKYDWVQQGIQVPRGLQMRPEDDDNNL
ncbi:hypothetical protein CBER1_07766 [Cercospora berteroae]|uniref:Protein kinase domain-containing protein n=1 Tax=Cercospora berteroae TaxID=357750 RepID=A0A2S6C3W4_9PEZI|nr:hypothetical protein CBER1_07766 [Cercospora berteroae]